MRLRHLKQCPLLDSKIARKTMLSPGGSARRPSPLPSIPPLLSATPYNLSSLNASTSQLSSYNQTSFRKTELSHSSIAPAEGNNFALGPGYSPPLLMPPSVFGRLASIPVSLYGSTPAQKQGEKLLLQDPSINRSINAFPCSVASAAASTSSAATSATSATHASFSAVGSRGVFANPYSDANASSTKAAPTTSSISFFSVPTARVFTSTATVAV